MELSRRSFLKGMLATAALLALPPIVTWVDPGAFQPPAYLCNTHTLDALLKEHYGPELVRQLNKGTRLLKVLAAPVESSQVNVKVARNDMRPSRHRNSLGQFTREKP